MSSAVHLYRWNFSPQKQLMIWGHIAFIDLISATFNTSESEISKVDSNHQEKHRRRRPTAVASVNCFTWVLWTREQNMSSLFIQLWWKTIHDLQQKREKSIHFDYTVRNVWCNLALRQNRTKFVQNVEWRESGSTNRNRVQRWLLHFWD